MPEVGTVYDQDKKPLLVGIFTNRVFRHLKLIYHCANPLNTKGASLLPSQEGHCQFPGRHMLHLSFNTFLYFIYMTWTRHDHPIGNHQNVFFQGRKVVPPAGTTNAPSQTKRDKLIHSIIKWCSFFSHTSKP